MFQKVIPALSLAVMLTLPVASQAASITVSTFNAVDYNSLFATGSYIGEDFETLGQTRGEGEVGPSLSTAVGTFTSHGGTGSGGTVTGLPGNSGTELALRDGTVFGRNNAVPLAGKWFLDANDTFGMVWDVSVGGLFDRIAFVLSDASDQGAFLRITTGSAVHEVRTGGKLADGNDRVVVVSFSEAVSAAQIALTNYTTFGGTTNFRNDGFAVDGAQVRLSPVPVPAAGLLMIAGLGALAALRARRQA